MCGCVVIARVCYEIDVVTVGVDASMGDVFTDGIGADVAVFDGKVMWVCMVVVLPLVVLMIVMSPMPGIVVGLVVFVLYVMMSVCVVCVYFRCL